jgi:prepilin-type N-terminal cleavage/methylation domain-containing protein
MVGKHHRSGGFTLVEVLAVVFLLALMMTAASANFGRFLPEARAEQAARGLLDNLDLARVAAIAHGRDYVMQIDLERGRYQTLTPWTVDGRPARLEEDKTSLGWESLPDGVIFMGAVDPLGDIQEEGIFEIVFSPYGDSSDLYFHLSAGIEEAFWVTVRITGITGMASIEEGHILPSPVTQADFD